MPSIETRTGDVAYEECGSGTPLVLLHANPGDHHDYDAVIPTLAEHYRVIAVDWPGYGASPAPNPPQSASAMLFADVLEDFVEALALEDAIFMGNSVGGFAAARLAAAHSASVKGLVLISPGGFADHNWFTSLFCAIKGREFVTRMIAPQFASFYLKRRNTFTAQILARAKAERASPSMVAVDAALWRSFSRPDHDLRRIAARITAPTLIIGGRYDPVIRVEVEGRKAASLISGARLSIPDTGHEPFAEDPESFLDIVRPFLKEVEGQRVPSYA